MIYLITGGTGAVGSLVVERLLERGVQPRIFVRDAGKAAAQFGDKVEIFTGDLAKPDTLGSAFDGADVIFLVNSGPDLAARDELAAATAKRCNVSRIVKLSSYDARENVGTGKWHIRGEAAIRAAGIPFTFVQPTGFMSNALHWAQSIKTSGVVRTATGDGKIPFIHPRDIAAVCVETLLSDQYRDSSIPITGPAALSYAEMAATIGSAIGKPVGIQAMSEDGVREEQLALGASESEVDAHLSIYQGIRDGVLSQVTDCVERVLGRKPISFSEWVNENVQAFR